MPSLRYTNIALLIATLVCQSASAASIWIEGEAPTAKDVNKHGWYDSVKKEGMSGGEWLSHYDNKPGTATYKFESPEAGQFTFWWRGNPFLAKVSYQLNGDEAKEIDFGDKRGEYMISEKPDHRFLAWVKVGKVALQAGENTITFKFHSDLSNQGGIDCFLFDNSGFVPSGALKPPGIGGAAGGDAAQAPTAGPDEAIWIEGEHPTAQDVVKHGWYDSVKKEGMSGGEWLSHYDGGKPGTATYKFDVAKADGYTFWWRGNPFLAKVSYQLNGAEPKEIDFAEKRGEYMISDKPDHRFLAWVKVGKVRLPAGENTITFKFHSDLSNQGGIDCFCFTRVPFVPSGTNKPASNTPATAGSGDWFPVVFDADAFSPDSVIDMSRFIEAPAGKHGFLKRDGEHLRFQQAKQPIQFWGCGANLQGTRFTREQLTARAPLPPQAWREHDPPASGARRNRTARRAGKFDSQKLDAWDWWCAELKKNGIYMTWSVFYGARLGPQDGYDAELFNELDIVDAGQNLRSSYGLVNLEPKLQDLQLQYLKALLKHKNPYTGLTPVEDPELAVLEFQNEDCVFFHNPLSGLSGGQVAQACRATSPKVLRMGQSQVRQRRSTQDRLGRAARRRLLGQGRAGNHGRLAAWRRRARRRIRGADRAGRRLHPLPHRPAARLLRTPRKRSPPLGFKAVTVTTAWRSGRPGVRSGQPVLRYGGRHDRPAQLLRRRSRRPRHQRRRGRKWFAPHAARFGHLEHRPVPGC